MTQNPWLLTVAGAALALGLVGGSATAAEAETTKTIKPEAALAARPEPAVCKQNFVNVRGQASITSEVVAQLKKGQIVTVLEEVTLKKPKTDEPAQWCRIALPTNSAAWVHSDYVDKTTKTVRPKVLNVRGGPSENHSVICRLEKGTALNILEEKGLWLKVEPPASASGFVAAHLLSKDAAAIAAASPPVVAAVPPTEPAPVVPTVVPSVVTNEPVVVTNVAVVPAVDTNVPAAVVTPPAASNVVEVAAAPANLAAIDGTKPPPAPAEVGKRIITREGRLRGAFSIQSPGYYELRSLDNNRTINYVWSPSTNIVLKSYKGQRVLITGEELLDERWPTMPVLTVDQIAPAP